MRDLAKISVKNEYGEFRLQTIIDEFKKRIYAEMDADCVKFLRLFGSYASDRQRMDSDIDLCLVFDEDRIGELRINLTVDKASDELLDQYGVIVHCLCFRSQYYFENEQRSLLFRDVENEGIAC